MWLLRPLVTFLSQVGLCRNVKGWSFASPMIRHTINEATGLCLHLNFLPKKLSCISWKLKIKSVDNDIIWHLIMNIFIARSCILMLGYILPHLIFKDPFNNIVYYFIFLSIDLMSLVLDLSWRMNNLKNIFPKTDCLYRLQKWINDLYFYCLRKYLDIHFYQ